MKKIVLGMFAAALVLQANAQEVKLAVKMAKGDKYEIVTKASVVNTMEMGGNEMKSTVESTNTQKFEVTDFANGKYTLTVENSGNIIKANSPMGGDMDLNANDGSGFDQFPGGMPKFLKEAAVLKFTLVIDETGKMISAAGFDKLSKPKQEVIGMMKMMLGGIDLNATDSAIIKNTLNVFKYANFGTLKPALTWEVVNADKKNGGKDTYTVLEVNEAAASVNVIGAHKIASTMSMGPQEIEVTGDMKSNGKIEIDAKTGLVTKSTINEDSKLTMNMGGNEMPNTNGLTTVITVTKK
jgi:hypothetical protein